MAEEADRGGERTRPSGAPKRGWLGIVLRIKAAASRHCIGLVAAGVAFYGLLAVFPALAAVVSVYGLIVEPAQVPQQFQSVTGLVPAEVQEIVNEQLAKIAGVAAEPLCVAAALGILLAFWGASKGASAFMMAMNIVYDEEESRGLVRVNLIALALTLFGIVSTVVALEAIVVVPVLLERMQLGQELEVLISVLRWPLIAAVFIAALTVLYRFAPCRSQAQWRWISAGSIAAVLMWLVASIAFSVYVQYIGRYNETYGALGAVIATMMWFWLSAFIILLGAELNAEMERQMRLDTTAGEGKFVDRGVPSTKAEAGGRV